jgi:N-acetylmuramoyl-L-alanine amidase
LISMATVALAGQGDIMANGAHLSGDATHADLTIELSKPLAFKVFALDAPYRVVIDLPAVEFRLPIGSGVSGTGLVTGYRYGLTGPGKSRIVLDATGPVLVQATSAASGSTGGAQLKIAVLATDEATFKAHLPHKASKPRIEASELSEAIPQPQIANQHRTIPLVVIDPGHGGPDSGAVSPDGYPEKTIVLAIGKKVRDKLDGSGHFKVLMTRDTDVFVTLKGRVDFAEQHGADLLVSIHADSTANSRRWQPVSGATVYTRSETASDEEARLVALKENMSDQLAGEALPADEGNAVGNIGLDLARTETKALDQVLADQTVPRLAKVTPMTLEPHRSARFYVLKSPQVPAMLIETGYVNNHADEPRLTSAEWQDRMADAIVDAINAYFAERNKGLATLLGVGLPLPAQQ